MQTIFAKLAAPFQNVAAFFVLYLIFLLPTYYLPYVGSNSSVVNAIGAAVGVGFTPQFWAHVASLFVLTVVTWLRGCAISKQWIMVFPLIASVFDMTPGLSLIPLLPTIMHVVALIMGVRGNTSSESPTPIPMAGAVTVSVVGSIILSGLVYSWTWQSRASNQFSAVQSNRPVPVIRANPPAAKAAESMPRNAVAPNSSPIFGSWSDGGPACASTKQGSNPRSLELRVWYCEADESAATAIMLLHDQTVNAFVDENSGLSMRLRPNGKLEISTSPQIRAKLSDSVFLSQDVTLLARK